MAITIYIYAGIQEDRLGGLVFRVPGYSSRGSGSIPGATRFFWEVVGLQRGPFSLVSTIEELLERGSATLTTRHPSIRKSWH
jgi:hypothetical protein